MAATVAQLARALADQPFLSALTIDAQRELAAHARRRDYASGEVVFAQGGAADRFFLIRRGLVRLSIEVASRGPVDIETLGVDAAFGWSWLLPPYQWHLSATAANKTSMLVFDAHRLHAVMEADPAIGYELMRRFAAIILDQLQAVQARLGEESSE